MKAQGDSPEVTEPIYEPKKFGSVIHTLSHIPVMALQLDMGILKREN